MRTIAEFLAASDHYDVRAVATTATERAEQVDVVALLRVLGCEPQIGPDGALRFESRAVRYALLDDHDPGVFDRFVDQETAGDAPDIVFTFGSLPHQVERRRRLRERGSLVAFGLRNLEYGHPLAFEAVDGVLVCSPFAQRWYEERIGLRSTPIIAPLDWDDVVAPQREPHFLTFVNPSNVKGAMLVARLAEMLGQRRPDIPILVVEARTGAANLVEAGLRADPPFDLRRHASIAVSPGVARPRDFFAATRVVVAPSVWDEPGGRIGAEAMANGVPILVSDRGGLPQTVRGGGFVLPLPPELTVDTPAPVSESVAAPWMSLVERLFDDESFYRQTSDACREAGRRFRPEAVAGEYLRFFDGLERSPTGFPAGITPAR